MTLKDESSPSPDNQKPSDIMNMKTPFPDWVPLFMHRLYGLAMLLFLLVLSWGGLFLQIVFTNLKMKFNNSTSPPDR